ncbi:FFLEELY motif protein [Noviherbaspirillum agri]
MTKKTIIVRLRKELDSVIAERRAASDDEASRAARLALRQFQSQRMAGTHGDLLANPETNAAAAFFLSDIYGTEDLTQRDANLERVVPTMERLLPSAALETVADAVALDALSERLDAAMAGQLGPVFSEADYIEAYPRVTARADRVRQLEHVESVGMALCALVQVPFIGSTLSMMRRPAKLADLADLQSFLERGFKAFKKMKRPEDFVATVVSRERAIMERLYGGHSRPFDLAATAV